MWLATRNALDPNQACWLSYVKYLNVLFLVKFLNTSVVVCLFPSSLICYTKRAVTFSSYHHEETGK